MATFVFFHAHPDDECIAIDITQPDNVSRALKLVCQSRLPRLFRQSGQHRITTRIDQTARLQRPSRAAALQSDFRDAPFFDPTFGQLSMQQNS